MGRRKGEGGGRGGEVIGGKERGKERKEKMGERERKRGGRANEVKSHTFWFGAVGVISIHRRGKRCAN